MKLTSANQSLHTRVASILALLVLSVIILAVTACNVAPNATPSGQTSTPATETRPPIDLGSVVMMNPKNVDNSVLPITPTESLHTTGSPPREVDIGSYRLVMDGLVDTPLSLTYQEVLSMPSVSKVVLLICPTVFADNAEWTGVRLSTLLEKAGVQPKAQELTFKAMDGYQTSLSLDDAMQEGVFLAYAVNGETLPLAHGYPFRVVVEHQYGYEWTKWIERIAVS